MLINALLILSSLCPVKCIPVALSLANEMCHDICCRDTIAQIETFTILRTSFLMISKELP